MTQSQSDGVVKTANRDMNSVEKRPIDFNPDHMKSAKRPKVQEHTDYSRWRLLDERGRQTWHYLEDDEDVKEWPQSTADKYFLGLPTVWAPRFTTIISTDVAKEPP